MPVRTLNYTDRKRIRREDACITLYNEEGRHYFTAELELAGYRLPPTSYVYVEAYRQAQYMRFSFGQAGELVEPNDRFLSKFDSPDGVMFRVKVVQELPRKGLLIAQASQIRPKRHDKADDDRLSLLAVQPVDSLGDQIWRLDFNDEQVILLVNSKLGDKDALVKHPTFRCLVYPEVVRYVLITILKGDKYDDLDDTSNWRTLWLRFARNLGVMTAMPPVTDEARVDDWIEDVVDKFCRQHQLLSAYTDFWTGEGR